jgi:nucleotide-binding universal stress UspA family protein
MNASARSIIVGIDLSSTSDLALDWAATEAARLGHPLSIVHAYTAPGYPAVRAGTPGGVAITDLDETLKGIAERAVAARAERVRAAHPGLVVRAGIRAGLPGAILVDASRDSELVVVGARGLGAVKGILVGSVSTHVCAHAHAPVIVVKEAASHTLTDTRVVVGVDASHTSQAALAFAFAFASSHHVGLTVVHTWQVDGVEGAAASLAWSVNSAQLGEQERSVVAEALAGYREQYPDVDVRRHVAEGHPVEELGRLSENACLLVVGTRGRGTVSGWFKGSVSQAVLRAAHCPVAVVHPVTPDESRSKGLRSGPGGRRKRHLPVPPVRERI